MSEKTLTDTTIEQAAKRIATMLNLVELIFSEAEARADAMRRQGYIVAPEAAQYVAEARTHLFRVEPDVLRAMYVLMLASGLEPHCYESAHKALLSLHIQATRAVVDAEMAAHIMDPR